ncbi:glycosyltransferase [Thomasclavelia cocleata]|uniref:glycosyltransferase n=1 Tax=Thomasclavelia cocleata TaxID=69824 RepID=UPI00242B8226|nr:glycosyltransferase [Thomasclavelia cocleata]
MKKCDIIIPIYNALDCLKECVDSVIKNTDLSINGLILIDDKSPDKNVKVYLKELENKYPDKNIDVLYNEKNLGFVGTVNRGMEYSKRDVLLLNSDTEVPAKWLDNIKKCAYSDKNIATVTALSNNATLVSVPIGLQPNKIPEKFSFEDYAKIVADASFLEYPDLPTAHGFCMFIKRKVLDLVGFFDAEKFGRGYGEENDFSFRCMDYGYRNVVCDNVIVLHKESQSFSDDKTQLLKHNLETLHERYPVYSQKIDLWCREFPLKKICDNIYYNIELRNKKNILFLVHDFNNPTTNLGGTTIHCMDLINELRSKYNFHVLFPSNGIYKVHSFFEKDERIISLGGVNAFSALSYYNNDYKIIVEKVIKGLQINVLHVHHMIGHYFDVLDICKENHVKSIITLHDFYCLCPSINMLYNMDEYCLNRDESRKDCKECLHNKMRLVNNIIPIWQKRWSEFLVDFDLVITPSKSTKEIIEKIYNKIECTAIEHGIKTNKVKSNLTSQNDNFNVAFVGVMAKHKGAKVVEYLIKHSNNKSIKYHLFGTTEFKSLENSTSNYTNHGKYCREELPMLLKENHIHLVCNLSIWPETYSYTLTETISSGVPVMALDLGAVSERIKKYGFGWVINSSASNEEILNTVQSIYENHVDYQHKIDNLNNYRIKTVNEMAKEYDNQYNVESRIFDVQALRELLEYNQDVPKVGYNAQLDEILNSRRWKLVSRIQLPEILKKLSRKIIK